MWEFVLSFESSVERWEFNLKNLHKTLQENFINYAFP